MSKIMSSSIRGYNSANNSATKSPFKHHFIAGFAAAALSSSSLINPAVITPVAAEVGDQTIGVVNGSDVFTSAIPGIADHVILSPTEDASTGMNVTFRANTAGTTVEYRLTGTDQAHTTIITEMGRTNHVYQFTELADFTSAIEYEYQIITIGGVSGPWDTSHTATAAPQNFDPIYFGDIQNGLTKEAKISARTIYNAIPNTALAVYTGDQANDTDDDEQRDQQFEARGPTARKMPMLIILGNHELKGDPLARSFQNHHTHPANGPVVLSGSTYYVDYQGVRFITLTSNSFSLSQRARFLNEALSPNPNQWSVVMFHQPVYSVTTRRITTANLRYFGNIPEEHNVDLVLNGHDHAYARGHRLDDEVDGENTGPIYAVSSAGSKFYEVKPENAAWDNNGADRKVWAKGAVTYTKTSVQDCIMTIDFVITHEGADNYALISINSVDQITDSFTIDKCGRFKQVRDNIQWPVGHIEDV